MEIGFGDSFGAGSDAGAGTPNARARIAATAPGSHHQPAPSGQVLPPPQLYFVFHWEETILVCPVRGKWAETPHLRGYFPLDPGVMRGDVTMGMALLSCLAPPAPKPGANG